MKNIIHAVPNHIQVRISKNVTKQYENIEPQQENDNEIEKETAKTQFFSIGVCGVIHHIEHI